ncbi:MAG: 30S ribosomal protein S12 methylthiotransferase RimO [Prevotellaceae bacterium]|nr:30S ribosomal protein S12 methylthiotransferase RimO [Prevotellaceae bacterium]
MRSDTVDIVTLGCSKNLVDSERLISQLEACGFSVTHDSATPQGETAVINTCGFIADAQEESINTILQFVRRKREGKLKRLYVMGCLSERFLADMRKEIPEVDKFYGKFNWHELLSDLGRSFRHDLWNTRHLTTPPHYAYLKVSEGCDRHCSYCAIPIITGRHKSRPMEDVLDEVRQLTSQGVRELQVVAQELTYYGLDLYGERKIAELVEKIAAVKGVDWIRLHYAYPTDFPDDLLRVIREHENVCNYLDIAFQHIADPVLSSMRRNFSSRQTYDLIETIRSEVPGIHLRTTLMVGYPTETEEGFQQLKDFVSRVRFERMGAFAYSEEMGTYSSLHERDTVSPETKESRLSELMSLQEGISAEVQGQKVGTQLKVIIDRTEGDYYIGRTEFDSPEVDPEVIIAREEGELQPGQFCLCQIFQSDDFDLYAHVIRQIP